MKIILLCDVKKLGHKGDVIDVSDGYARNYILPQKVGIEATKDNLCKLQNNVEKMQREEEQRVSDAKVIAQNLENKKIVLYIKAGENGKTFGSVTSKEIADEIKNVYKYDIDKKKIELSDAIKNIGMYEVTVKIYKDVVTTIKVEVKNG